MERNVSMHPLIGDELRRAFRQSCCLWPAASRLLSTSGGGGGGSEVIEGKAMSENLCICV